MDGPGDRRRDVEVVAAGDDERREAELREPRLEIEALEVAPDRELAVFEKSGDLPFREETSAFVLADRSVPVEAVSGGRRGLVHPVGLEPTRFGLKGRRSTT